MKTAKTVTLPVWKLRQTIYGFNIYRNGRKMEGPIEEEWIKAGKPMAPDTKFREWKRGFWAGRMQKRFAEAKGEA